MRAAQPTPAPFAAGDLVRCTSTHAGGTKFPLKLNHLYRVRCIAGGDSPHHPFRVFLHRHARAFDMFRFALECPAKAAAAEVERVTRRMAQVMRDCEGATGVCTADDLACAGFTAAQIIEYADEARGLAGAPSGLMAA